jgi:hypothetical protein
MTILGLLSRRGRQLRGEVGIVRIDGFGRGIGALLLCALLLIGGKARAWNSDDMTGALPALSFTMTRASDGKTVSAADYRGKIVLLYFGYTNCPDVCPTTLLNLTTMLKSMGKQADDVRVLFVTVDPNRDTLAVLKQYTQAFAPQVVGLRGTHQAAAPNRRPAADGGRRRQRQLVATAAELAVNLLPTRALHRE